MKTSKLTVLMLMTALGCAPAFAEKPKIQPLDKDLNPIEAPKKEIKFSAFRLEDAIQLALENNRTIKSSASAIEVADAKVGQARATNSFKVTATATKTRLDKVMNNGHIVDTSKYTNSESISFTQPLYLAGADKASLKAARLGREAAKASHTLTKQQIIMKVSLGYYNWLYANAIEQVSIQDLELAQTHYDLVNKRYKAEQASRYELLRADVRLADSKSSQVKKRNDSLMARLELLKILALPMDTQIVAAEDLEIIDLHPNVLEDLQHFTELRQDLKAKKAQKHIAEQQLKIAKAGYKPRLVFNAKYGSDKPANRTGTFNADESWNATIAFETSLLDGRLTKHQISEAEVGVSKAQNDYDDVLESAELEIYKSALSLQAAIEVMASQVENLKHAEETLRLAKVRYENGLFSQIDLFDAENAWSNSKLVYLASVFDHHRARLNYLLAVGKLGRDINGF